MKNKVSFLFHIYQPPIQYENIAKKIFETSYIPLIKTIKNNKDFHVTLNIPLSLLEQADSLGYATWISDIALLVEQGRIELVGTAAYHCLLPKTNEEIATRQIILQEYALGYFFGRKQGFEGEPSILVRNLVGFFPPELAIDSNLVNLLGTLNYDWVLANDSAIKDLSREAVSYKLEESSTKIVFRNSEISDQIAFTKVSNVDEVLSKIMSLDDDVVVAFDGEFFGHHFKEGISYLEDLISALKKNDVGTQSISEFVKHNKVKELETLNESTWSHNYDIWIQDSNEIQHALWNIYHSLSTNYSFDVLFNTPEGLENVAVWGLESLSNQTEVDSANRLFIDISVLKSLHSDQFWWSSSKNVCDVFLFNKHLILKSLEIYKNISNQLNNTQFKEDFNSNYSKILEKLEE